MMNLLRSPSRTDRVVPEGTPLPSARWRRRLSLLVPVLLAIAAASFVNLWSSIQDARRGAALAALVRPDDIHLIVSDHCAPCRQAELWLQRHAVAYSSCSIERDPRCRARYEALGAVGTPVIQVRGVSHAGFSPERLLQSLSRPR